MSDVPPPPPPGGYGGYGPQGAPPGYVPAGYGYGYPAAPKTDGMAIAAMVLGIVSFVLCWAGILTGVLAIVFGLVSLSRIKKAGGSLTGRGMAIAGFVCGILAMAMWVLFIVIGVLSVVAAPV